MFQPLSPLKLLREFLMFYPAWLSSLRLWVRVSPSPGLSLQLAQKHNRATGSTGSPWWMPHSPLHARYLEQCLVHCPCSTNVCAIDLRWCLTEICSTSSLGPTCWQVTSFPHEKTEEGGLGLPCCLWGTPIPTWAPEILIYIEDGGSGPFRAMHLPHYHAPSGFINQ